VTILGSNFVPEGVDPGEQSQSNVTVGNSMKPQSHATTQFLLFFFFCFFFFFFIYYSYVDLCTQVTWVNSTMIVCTVPPGTGDDNYIVVSVGGQLNISSHTYNYTGTSIYVCLE
jgi:hypothetical protein